jgi:5,6,7,8-tetrahydromethanopterin hydro-lyase
MELGEGFTGSGAEAAHVNTVLGRRDGSVGTAWATALASPSTGHAPFVVVLQPGLPVQPFTLFVNKAAIAGERHAAITWGAAQAGIAAGVTDALTDGLFEGDGEPGTLALIAAVWVDPAADDEALVAANNREAVRAALALGRAGLPGVPDLRGRGGEAWNPFYRPG